MTYKNDVFDLRKLIKKVIPSPVKKNLKALRILFKNILFIKSKGSIFYGPITYAEDGLIASQCPSFNSDPLFRRSWACAQQAGAMAGPWRTYICCWFANHVKSLPGDFVECGVNTGAYARAVMEYTDFRALHKTFYLLDTFNGLVRNQVTDAEMKAGIRHYFGNYSDVYENTLRTFEGFPACIIRGEIPGTLPQCKTEAISYLSIDMNCVFPEIAALDYFFPKVVKGGVIILDDYGFPMHINQKIAFDGFAAKHQLTILALPTGQGVIIK